FEIVSELIMHLDFQQILQLQEAEVFVAKTGLLVAMQIDVSPLTEKTLERQGRYGFLDGLADIGTGRVKDREGAIKAGPGILQYAAGAGHWQPQSHYCQHDHTTPGPPHPSRSRQLKGRTSSSIDTPLPHSCSPLLVTFDQTQKGAHKKCSTQLRRETGGTP